MESVTLPFADSIPIRFGIAVAALAIYWAVLRVALRLTGESLALTDFVTEAPDASRSA